MLPDARQDLIRRSAASLGLRHYLYAGNSTSETSDLSGTFKRISIYMVEYFKGSVIRIKLKILPNSLAIALYEENFFSPASPWNVVKFRARLSDLTNMWLCQCKAVVRKSQD